MGNLYQPDRKPGNPDLHPPLYEGINVSVMALANSVVVFLRRDFGTRAMHPMTFVGPFAFHMGLGYLCYQATNVPYYVHESGIAMMVFAVLMSLLATYHERRGLALAFRNPPVHTMSRGVSALMPLCRSLHISAYALQSVIEPLLILAVGHYMIDQLQWYLFGWWLVLASGSLLYVEVVVQAHAVNAALDLRDSRAEAEFLMGTERSVSDDRNSVKGKRGKDPDPNVARLSPEVMRMKPGQKTVTRERDSQRSGR